FEFIFDPQLYFPRRADRGQLATWSYFPKDFDTADMSSEAWWTAILGVLAGSVRRRAIPAAGSLSLGGGEGDGVRLPGGTKV
ncbi:MAG: hypothetical protein ACLQBL_13515, partial [Polyangiaceae bacterium]